ncbi:MAG: RNHCP domain-containing protein [Clostridia bacterium]|nr:RNHCP domain-containing protein [Clostridia bacterium]
METKRFSKNDSGFTCVNCGFEVEPLIRTSRNHCPKCLCSLHVDVLPGDRANECAGVLRPIRVFPDAKKGYVIHYKCDKCGQEGNNKAALKKCAKDVLPDEQYDNEDLLIKLTKLY